MAVIKATTPEEFSARGRLAVRQRDYGADDPRTAEARREFRSERWLSAVRAAVADAPPLDPARRARLAEILRPVVTVASAELTTALDRVLPHAERTSLAHRSATTRRKARDAEAAARQAAAELRTAREIGGAA